MTNHTPGPWTVSDLDAYGNQTDEFYFIQPNVAVVERKVDGKGDEYDLPNAHLIAASPDLLAALEEAVAKDCLAGAMLTDARAAIAKARGEA